MTENVMRELAKAQRMINADKLQTNFKFEHRVKKLEIPEGFQALPISSVAVDNLVEENPGKTPSEAVVGYLGTQEIESKMLETRLIWLNSKSKKMIWVPNDFARISRQIAKYLQLRSVNAPREMDVAGMFILRFCNRYLTKGFCYTPRGVEQFADQADLPADIYTVQDILES